MKKHLSCLSVLNVLLVLAFLYGVGLAMGKILYSDIFFNIDVAIDALMAQKALEGEFPLYWWGQRYYAPFHAFSVAPFFWLFGETNLAAYRIPGLIATIVVFILLFLFVDRTWGRKEATLSLLFFATPSWLLYWYLSGTSLYRFILLFGLLYLLFFEAKSLSWTFRALGVGLVTGLAVWFTPQFYIYPLLLIPVLLLLSPLWQSTYETLSTDQRRVACVLWCAFLLAYAYIVQQMFSPLSPLFGAVRRPLMIAAIVFLLWGSVSLYQRRFTQMLTVYCIGVCGFLLGIAPQLIGWMSYGIKPQEEIGMHLPLHDAMYLQKFLNRVLLQLLNIGYLYGQLVVLQRALLTGIIVCVALFLWSRRDTLKRFLSMQPLSRKAAVELLLCGVFVVPLVAALLSGKRGPVDVRYVVDAYLGYVILLSLSLTYIAGTRKRLGVLFCVVFVTVFVLSAQRSIVARWPKGPEMSFRESELIANRMSLYGVPGGYAHFKTAYMMNFFQKEGVIFAPRTRHDKRRPAYRMSVDSFPRFAYIDRFSHRISRQRQRIRHVIETGELSLTKEPQSDHVRFLERVARSDILFYERIGNTDMWLFSDPLLAHD